MKAQVYLAYAAFNGEDMPTYTLTYGFGPQSGGPREAAGVYEFEASDDTSAAAFAAREYDEAISLCDYATLAGPSGFVREWEGREAGT